MIDVLLARFMSKTERRKKRAQAKELAKWAERAYSEQSPQFIKEALFLKYGIKNAPWVETGTYKGKTTSFLVEHFPLVHTIEPEPNLYRNAVEAFTGRNAEIYNGTSEDILPSLLPKLSGDVNFWLDGHYSAGITYRGDKDCPVEDELEAISRSLANFGKVLVMIDDVRCFLPENKVEFGYPSIYELTQWADKHHFYWRIEHDIFIMRN